MHEGALNRPPTGILLGRGIQIMARTGYESARGSFGAHDDGLHGFTTPPKESLWRERTGRFLAACLLIVPAVGCASDWRSGDVMISDAGPLMYPFRVYPGRRYRITLPELRVDRSGVYTFHIQPALFNVFTFSLATNSVREDEPHLRIGVQIVDCRQQTVVNAPCLGFIASAAATRTDWSASLGGFPLRWPQSPQKGTTIFARDFSRWETTNLRISRDQFPLTVRIEVCEPSGSGEGVMIPNLSAD